MSGGKDGSYVTYYCKEKLKLDVLCVTINPPMRSSLGYKNLENFKKNNIDLIEINLPSEAHRKLNYFGFVNSGRPLYGWLISIITGVHRVAHNFNVDLIMYGEDGETEYGGVSKLKNKAIFDFDFAKKIYFSGEYSSALKLLSTKDKYWWTIPEKCKIKMTHWSYFENWDSYRNFVISKKYMGYEESKKKCRHLYKFWSKRYLII